jgi:hypothetical protein
MAASKSSDRSRKGRSTSRTSSTGSETSATGDGLGGLAEQLVNRVMKPLGLVVLSRERIEEVLTDAAERGRITRSDANDLVAELVRRGRAETELLLGELDRLMGRGRQQLSRGANRAKRSVGMGGRFPISGYDKLTVAQVKRQLPDLTKAELRQVREYELRHANRRSVLSAIDTSTG